MLESFVIKTRPEFQEVWAVYKYEYDRRCPTHPPHQREIGGLGIHTCEVITMALTLNQEHNERDVIETALAHDLKNWRNFPLADHQVLAIEATKGLRYKRWRQNPQYHFVALILVADMWSAFVNVWGEESWLNRIL